jgi:hypothetical protein
MSDAQPAAAPGLIARFNESFARHATLVFGTMGMFYVFALYSLLPIADPKHQVTYLLWSNAAQLVALPLIMVGTNILGRDSERRAAETHDAVMEELAILRREHAQSAQQTAELHALTVEGRLPERAIRPDGTE